MCLKSASQGLARGFGLELGLILGPTLLFSRGESALNYISPAWCLGTIAGGTELPLEALDSGCLYLSAALALLVAARRVIARPQ